MLILVLISALLLRGAASQCVSNCGCLALPDSCCLTVQENQPPGQIGVDDSTEMNARLMNYSEPRFLFTGQDANPDDDSIVFGVFQINAQNATVFTLKTLDREGEAFLEDGCVILPVAVKEDDGVNELSFTIVVEVLDVNDNPPAFSVPSFTFNIPETYINANGEVSRVECTFQMVSMLTVTDADQGDNAVVTYSVEGDQSSLFVIEDPSVPCVVNAPGMDLDRDIPPSEYSFTLVATNQGVPNARAEATVTYILEDVNDNGPTFGSQMYTIPVREDSQPMSEIFQFTATDPDLGTELCYSINGDGTFEVNQTTGSLTLARNLDAESTSTVELTVMVTSKGMMTVTPQVPTTASASVHINVVDVNEEATIHLGALVPSLATEITENEVVPVIVDLVVEDHDREPENVNNTLSVVRDSAGIFELLTIPGQSLWILWQVSPVDFEEDSTIQVQIQSTEYGDPVLHQTILYNLTVLDVNDNAPDLSQKQFSISEDEEGTGSDRQIVDLRQYVFDDDGPDNNVIGGYSLVSVTSDTADLMDDFTGVLDGNTGVLSTAGLDISLDRETYQTPFIFSVSIIDTGMAPLSRVVKFSVTLTDVNDNSPVFDELLYSFNITENQDIGTLVGVVHATDLDYRENSTVTYSIWEVDSQFDISELTGELRSAAEFDREIRDSYQITIQARDNGNPPQFAQDIARVMIRILDENDELPFFREDQPHSFIINTKYRTGDEVGTVTAIDNDEPPNNRIVYAMESPSDIFIIEDSSVGTITLQHEITEEHVGTYQLNISAYNPDMESQADRLTVSITINKTGIFTLQVIGAIAGGAAALLLLLIVVVAVLIACVCYKNRRYKRRYDIKEVSLNNAQKTILKIPASNTQQSHSCVTFSEHVQETHYREEDMVLDTCNVIRKESTTKSNDSHMVVALDMVVDHTCIPNLHLHHNHYHTPPHSPIVHGVLTQRVEEEEMSSDSDTFEDDTMLHHHHHHPHHHSDSLDMQHDTRLRLYSHFPGMSQGKSGKSILEQLHAHNLAQLMACGQQQQPQGPPLDIRDEHSHSPSQTSVKTQLPHLDSESTQSASLLICIPTPSPLGQASILTQSTLSDSQSTEHSGILTPPPLGQTSMSPNSSCDPTPPTLGQTSISRLSTQTPHSCIQTPSLLGQISVPTQSTQSQPRLQGPSRRTHKMGAWSGTSMELDRGMKFNTDNEPEIVSLTVKSTISEEEAAV